MGLEGIIDEKGEVRLNISYNMREKADELAATYDPKLGNGKVNLTRHVANSNPKDQFHAFREAVYEANPYLDPATMKRPAVLGIDVADRPVFKQRLDMERSVGPRLNAVIAEAFKAAGREKEAPKAFDETPQRGH